MVWLRLSKILHPCLVLLAMFTQFWRWSRRNYPRDSWQSPVWKMSRSSSFLDYFKREYHISKKTEERHKKLRLQDHCKLMRVRQKWDSFSNIVSQNVGKTGLWTPMIFQNYSQRAKCLLDSIVMHIDQVLIDLMYRSTCHFKCSLDSSRRHKQICKNW